MVGFKSFAEKTLVEFGPGISAIVGPNGSGKSNLADALRWALGEQGRSLRIRRAEDVIFAGSERRNAIGMADVTLVLDNADGLLPVDFAEVAVGRRLFRSGENDYLVNRQRVRHRDLVELLDAAALADNAFLFIGQGMVDQALALRPEERRPLFEEVAGVRRHDRRRRLAEAQLAEADANLARVRDVLDELRPQARRLSQQVQQEQARAAAADEFARGLIASAWGRWREAAVSRRAGAEALEAARTRAAEAARELRAAEERIAALGRSLDERIDLERATRTDLDRARAESTELRLAAGRLESSIATIERDLARLADERAAVDVRIAAERRIASAPLPEPDPEASAALAIAERDLAGAAAEVERLRTASTETEERGAAARRAVAAREAELDVARRRTADLAARSSEQSVRCDAARDVAGASEVRRAAAAGSLDRATEREKAAESALHAARAAMEEAAGLDGERSGRASEASALAGSLRARIEAIEERLAAEEGSAIARAARRRGGRRVAEGLDIEPALRAAVEAALGVALRAAVVPAAEVAGLRGERGTLVLADAAPPRGAERELERARASAVAAGGGALADAVRHDPGGAASRLLASALWVPDLAGALDIRARLPAGWCVATPAGEVVSASGVLTVAGRATLLDLRAERDALAARQREADDRAVAAVSLAAQAAASMAGTRAAYGAAETAAGEARRERRHAEESERVAARAAEQAAREYSWESAQAERLHADARRAAEALASLEGPGAASAVGSGTVALTGAALPVRSADLEARLGELSERRDRLASAIESGAAERRRAEDARSRAEATIALDERSLERIGREIPELAAEREVASAERSRLEARLAAVRERERAQAEVLATLLTAVASERDALGHADRSAASAREALRVAEERFRAAGVIEVEGRLAQETVREQLLVELAAVGPAGLAALRDDRPVDVPAVGSEDDVVAALEEALAAAADRWAGADPPVEPPGSGRLGTLRRRFHELGATNPFAEREYTEVRARLDDLEGQRADLERAIDTTRSLIVELTELITEQFRATFRALEGAFERRFATLFEGGYARLSLTDPDDLGATGVEIVAQPPGKKRQPLAMLSGGERALTAVALLFAMLEVRPVPFCVLDEVDAALDEANIGRFAESLQELAQATQCIVITHNRGTIEAADALYGVTIGEDAVSRVISLRLEQPPIAVPDGLAAAAPADARG
jgi:chromosome segregation protein